MRRLLSLLLLISVALLVGTSCGQGTQGMAYDEATVIRETAALVEKSELINRIFWYGMRSTGADRPTIPTRTGKDASCTRRKNALGPKAQQLPTLCSPCVLRIFVTDLRITSTSLF